MSLTKTDWQQTIRDSTKSTSKDTRVRNDTRQDSINIDKQEYDLDNIIRTMTDKGDKLRNQQTQEMFQQTSNNTSMEEEDSDALYQFVGDGEPKKQKNTIRLYYNNCNGLAPTKLVRAKMAQRKLKEEKNS